MKLPETPIPVKDHRGNVIGKVIDIREDDTGIHATMDIAGDEFRGLALAKNSISEHTAEVFMPRGALARGPRLKPLSEVKRRRREVRESRRRNRGNR